MAKCKISIKKLKKEKSRGERKGLGEATEHLKGKVNGLHKQALKNNCQCLLTNAEPWFGSSCYGNNQTCNKVPRCEQRLEKMPGLGYDPQLLQVPAEARIHNMLQDRGTDIPYLWFSTGRWPNQGIQQGKWDSNASRFNQQWLAVQNCSPPIAGGLSFHREEGIWLRPEVYCKTVANKDASGEGARSLAIGLCRIICSHMRFRFNF